MRLTFYFLTFILLFSCSSNKSNNKIQKSDTSVYTIVHEEKPKSDIDNNYTERKVLQLKKTYKFEDYKVSVFKGKLAEPNFESNPYANDNEYITFIKKGCDKNKINFAGNYTIIERDCGAECLHVFIVDRKSGKIFTDIKPNDGRYGYEYREDSELLIANSNLFIDDKFEKYIY